MGVGGRAEVSRRDGADTSLKMSACNCTHKWAHCVKQGGTAGMIFTPVPAYNRDRSFLCPE